MQEKVGHKIAIIGPSCSGKSTLALQLAGALNLPVFHLDRLVWLPGYAAIEAPAEQVERALSEIVAQPRWVTEGVYVRWLPLQVQAADLVIFLDLSRAVCLYRYMRRLWRGYRGHAKQLGLHEGDEGRFSWGMVSWILQGFPKKRAQIYAILQRAPNKVMVLSSPRAISDFLQRLG